MMTLIPDDTLRSQVATYVQSELDKHQPRNYKISVQKNAVLAEDDWIQILVVSPDDQRDRDFYDALAATEQALSARDDGLNYLLVPVIVDD